MEVLGNVWDPLPVMTHISNDNDVILYQTDSTVTKRMHQRERFFAPSTTLWAPLQPGREEFRCAMQEISSQGSQTSGVTVQSRTRSAFLRLYQPAQVPIRRRCSIFYTKPDVLYRSYPRREPVQQTARRQPQLLDEYITGSVTVSHLRLAFVATKVAHTKPNIFVKSCNYP